MLKTLCYVSNSNMNFTNKDLDQLFNITKKNNLKLNITGVLIFNNGNFLQIMEGDEKKISNLYLKISLDKKHSNLIKLIEKPITERMFEDYGTGFSVIKDRKKQKPLYDYLDWLKNAEIQSVDKIIHVIEQFCELKI